jgi:hypothetical protein
MAADEEWLKRWRAAQERQWRHSERLAEYLIPALRFLGVDAVGVEFDGYGDQGDVQQPVFEGGPEELPEGLSAFVESACRWALPGGWDDNAGSCGEWIIYVESGFSDLEFEWRDEDPQNEE